MYVDDTGAAMRTVRPGADWGVILLQVALLAGYATGEVRITQPAAETVTVTAGRLLHLTCVSSDAARMAWYQNADRVTDETVGAAVTQEDDLNTGVSTSTLTLVAHAQLRRVSCRNPSQIFDTDDIAINIAMTSDVSDVEIINPVEPYLSVDEGQGMTVTCVGEADSQLHWLHNGVPVREGGRVIITTARSVYERRKTAIMSVRRLRPSDAGTYTCEDERDYYKRDELQLTVTPAGAQRGMVSIVRPGQSALRLAVGEPLLLICRAGLGKRMTWTLDGDVVPSGDGGGGGGEGGGGYDVRDVTEVDSRVETSVLTKEAMTKEDSGTYACHDAEDATDRDVVVVTVDRQASLPPPTRAARKATVVVMRIGSSVTLHCSYDAMEVYGPEWSKGDQLMTSGRKHVINSDTEPTILQIRNTDRNDVGLYFCRFRRPVDGGVAGVVVFNVTTVPCPPLLPPPNADYENCPSAPLFGETCSFKCNSTLRLSVSAPMTCERSDAGVTFWRGDMPSCESRHSLLRADGGRGMAAGPGAARRHGLAALLAASLAAHAAARS